MNAQSLTTPIYFLSIDQKDKDKFQCEKKILNGPSVYEEKKNPILLWWD